MQNLKSRRKLIYRLLLIFLATGTTWLLGRYMWQEMRWRWIVVHHTASDTGNLEYYKRLHKEERGWPDVAYHFVINNGTMNTSPGEIEVSDLWKERQHHYSTRNSYINYFGIAIVLVGNFERHEIPPRQYESLLNLITRLAREYKIPPERIVGHNELQNTRCPGSHTDMNKIRSEITEKLQKGQSDGLD